MIRPLRLGLLFSLLVITAYYAVLHYQVLQIGYPITQDEPGFVELAAAGNPYTHDGLLAAGNVYGPGYPIWARPFTAVFSNPYIALRWASSCALFAMLGLLGWVLRREGLGRIETAAALAIVYILNVSSHSLSASADLLGAALYFASITASRRGTWPALIAGVALAACAMMTKPYFALGWVIVASHLLLFAPPRRALTYLGLSALLAVVSATVLQSVAPDYFLSTVVVHGTAAVRRADVLFGQAGEFALLACGVLALALLFRPKKYSLTLSIHRPLLQPAIDLWAWAAGVAAVALLGSLGWHPGNYLVYYYHLLLGPLVIVALRRLASRPQLGRGLLCVNLLVLGWLLPPLPGNDNWGTLEPSVATVRGCILAEPLLQPFSQSHLNLELLTHGQTASILQALDNRGAEVPAAYASLHRKLLARAEVQSARIRAREFAAVYLSYVLDSQNRPVWSNDLRHILPALFTGYQPAEEIPVYPYGMPYWARLSHGRFPYHVVKWVPKNQPPEPPLNPNSRNGAPKAKN